MQRYKVCMKSRMKRQQKQQLKLGSPDCPGPGYRERHCGKLVLLEAVCLVDAVLQTAPNAVA